MVMQHNQFVSFNGEDGKQIDSTPDTFLLFIDETGEESLKDPNFPIFGFGAVGLPAYLYSTNMRNPWELLKDKEFGGKDKPLHASDLRNPSIQQMEILDIFFKNNTFCRVAAIVSNKTTFDNEINLQHLLAPTFYQRLLKIFDQTRFDQIFMVFEDSQRASKSYLDFFSRYEVTSTNEKGETIKIPRHIFFMSKKEMEPGMEVADFVAHTAGASVYSRLKGKRSKDDERKDFDAVFNSIDKKLTDFIEITRVKTIS